MIGSTVDAAVLLPLYGWPDDPGLIFTERRADLRRHAGEISFPGGRYDEADADLQATEVGQVLELELERVRAGYARRRLVRRGMPFRTDTYDVDGHLIWGATGRILQDLLGRI